jgi:hypothetical protein
MNGHGEGGAGQRDHGARDGAQRFHVHPHRVLSKGVPRGHRRAFTR